MAELKCPKCNGPIPYNAADESKAVACPACGVSVFAVEAAEKLLSLKCTACGGALDLQPGAAQITCPFCNASYLLPIGAAPAAAPAAAGVPHFVAPFKVAREGVLEPLRRWLNQGAFTASDADTAAVVTAVTPKYVPLYVFTCNAMSNWTGQYGTQHSRPVQRTRVNAQGRTEYYSTTETYTEWHPTSGTHSGHYRVAVSASAALAQSDLNQLAGDAGNFVADEGATPHTGTLDQPADAPAFDAAEGRRRALIQVEALERKACEGQVERLGSCATQASDWDGRLNYHPFWWVTYQYKGKAYACVMDGRTGAAAGRKPKSKTKIILAVIIAAVLLAILIVVILTCVAGGYFTNAAALSHFAAAAALT
jgi:LSD1 subclass zinc finger protein